MIEWDELRQLLHYDPDTGLWRWLVLPRGRWKRWEAGSLNKHGYIDVTIRGSRYKAHRLAWFYMTGEWPTDTVDHENTKRDDNRWKNLRLATDQQNKWNSRRPRHNTSGFKGVAFHKASNKWRASISLDGRTKQLGVFDTPEEAHQVYIAAATQRSGIFVRAA